MDFALYSQGCCGSIRMVECLKAAGLVRVCEPGYEAAHTRYPPFRSPSKVLYMYGDPRNILLSCINRGEEWIHAHCSALQGDVRYIKHNTDKIISDGYDPLHLETHFMNWFSLNPDYDIMFLKYEALEDPKIFQQVLDFFGVVSDKSYDWCPRKTSYKNLFSEEQIQITDLFSDLLKLQDQLPSCMVKGSS